MRSLFQLYRNPIISSGCAWKETLDRCSEHTIADGLVGNYFHEILVGNLAFVDDPKTHKLLQKWVQYAEPIEDGGKPASF